MSVNVSESETPMEVQLEDNNGVKIEEKKPIDIAKAKASFQDRAQQYLVEQGKHIIMPSFSKWFDMNEIHDIEKTSFPDFFDETSKSSYKSANSYKYTRDFMINCYRLNPIEYLTVTALRRSLSGDVASIIRIHQFLEKWGLINYQIDPRTKPSTIAPQYTGHFQIVLDTPRALVPFIAEDVEIINESPIKENGDLPSPVSSDEDFKTIPLNLEVRRNIYDENKDFKENTNQYICNVAGKDTNEVRYHNLKSKDQSNIAPSINNGNNISEECFQQGLFPSNFQSTDFLKFSKQKDNDIWTEQDIILLLEGIEMFGTNDITSNDPAENLSQFTKNSNQWERISNHVGTKSKQQCILKFIQLPIEDKYLNKLIDTKSITKESSTKENLVEKVVEQIIKSNEGKELLTKNSQQKLDDINKDSTGLINQITELTLEKVNLKLNNLSLLEDNLVNIENQLNLERKQLSIERWLQYEKIMNFKKSNQIPEISNLLDDLLTPVSIKEINKEFNKKIDLSDSLSNSKDTSDVNNLPLSVTKPQAYQFWSG
ncbi:chromatin structure-remodeling complex protein Rsc8p [[Candida] jaroonii]|uniref:Chromatin structure-remodeling complex protein Rsc8p n=1 Tax=[Candida] jaroonii TaxID=467808 RepID=A0ACA9Y5E5_9ASCO|nr:chromatin structure-remodeling complex protein Rsc8p [[Candida] jaroonii]